MRGDTTSSSLGLSFQLPKLWASSPHALESVERIKPLPEGIQGICSGRAYLSIFHVYSTCRAVPLHLDTYSGMNKAELDIF